MTFSYLSKSRKSYVNYLCGKCRFFSANFCKALTRKDKKLSYR